MLSLALSVQAQNANSPHEGLCAELSTTPGNVSVRWWGKAGRTYFVQTSTTLLPDSWSYLPTVEGGADAIKSIGMAAPSGKLFVRLVYTDAAYTGDVGAADADGDGLSNALEVSLAIRSNPLVPDTDGDGFTDGVEHQYGYSPTLASSNPELVAGTRYLETTSASFSARHVVSRPQAGVDFWFRKKTYYGMPGYNSQPQENFTDQRPPFPPIPPLPEFNSLSFGAWTAFSSDNNPVAFGEDYYTNIGESEVADYAYVWSKMRIRAAAPSLRDRHYWLGLESGSGREFRQVVLPAGAVIAEEPVKQVKLNNAAGEVAVRVLLEFEVVGRGQRGDLVPSVNGTAGDLHYVTPKWAQDIDGNNYKTVIVQARGMSQFHFTGSSPKYQWNCVSESTGASAGAPDPTDASKFIINRETPDHFTLSVVPTNATNAVTGKIHVWVVWADCTPTLRPAGWDALTRDTGIVFGGQPVVETIGGKWRVPNEAGLRQKFVFTIHPASICASNVAEKPKLDGVNSMPVPGAGKTYSVSSGPPDHASSKWDVSRQMKVVIRNPFGIEQSALKDAGTSWFGNQPTERGTPMPYDNPVPWPTDLAEGNDDPSGFDEDADPYNPEAYVDLAHGVGQLSSMDAPLLPVRTGWASPGAYFYTYDVELNFREFCRLEIHDGARTTGKFWFRISDFYKWHHYLRAAWDGSSWYDSNSSAGSGNPTP
jgi:hypothetical protein